MPTAIRSRAQLSDISDILASLTPETKESPVGKAAKPAVGAIIDAPVAEAAKVAKPAEAADEKAAVREGAAVEEGAAAGEAEGEAGEGMIFFGLPCKG